MSLSRGNPRDLLHTVQSLELQTIAPDQHLVIDSSEPDIKPHIQAVCEQYGSEYVWVEPEGIYPAMRFGLGLLSPDDYCMFLNSGDRLHSHESMSALQEILAESTSPTPIWLIGGISILEGDKEKERYIPPQVDSRALLNLLRDRKAWLPHPSTAYLVSALREVKPFEGPYKIASDLATGIRMVK